MLIPIYSPIKLLTNRYLKSGVKKGDYGVIIEVYDNAYEVEFMDEEGNTIDWFSVKSDEVEMIEESNSTNNSESSTS